MIAALIVAGAWQTLDVILLLVAARFGVASVHVRKPPKPRKRPEATS